MYSYISAALAMAASVSALPAVQTRQDKDLNFGLAVQLNGERVQLGYSFNGTSDRAVLVADPTLPYANAHAVSSPDTTAEGLDITIDGVDYGVIAGNLGVGSGRRQGVVVEQGQQEFAWQISTDIKGSITHNLTHADEAFVVCEDTVDGKSAYILTWASENLEGNYSPCIYTGLYRN